jgi:NAD(P)-dependent dehydrogenase (short-subunit alcohol dehydrogenase family)
MKIALITGANKGIGFETAQRLTKAGCRVYLAARNPQSGQPAADKIGCRFLQIDVTSEDSVQQAAALINTAEGRLDVLVNNAGISGPIHEPNEYTADEAATVLMTNVVGYVRMIHAFLPLLEKSDNPVVVNVSSGLGSFGLFHDPSRIESRFGSPLYAASKAAINMLTARYARLLPNMHINAIDPGMTATDLSGGQGHSLQEGTEAIVSFALADGNGPSGAFYDSTGILPW